jgi:hypothetical protein
MPGLTQCSSIALAACLLLRVANAQADTYYVAPSGNDTNNDGKSVGAPWATVTHAAVQAKAGDTVYIQAGLYIDEAVLVANSGTQSAPIIFQGYQSTPGDTPDPQYQPGDTPKSAVMPVLEAQSTPLQESGTAFGLDKRSYVEIRNLSVAKYNTGIYPSESDHVVIENVYVLGAGILDSGGQGIFSYGSANITVRNCTVADSSMTNIILWRTTDSTVENCRSYAVAYDPNNEAPTTDYHIVLADSQNNVVQNCLAENLHWQVGGHQGHGIGVKDQVKGNAYPNPHSENNKFINCVANDMGEHFFVAHEAHHNEFVDCQGTGHYSQYPAGSDWSEGINIRDGAHDNTFRNMHLDGARTSIAIQDTVEGLVDANNVDIPQIATNNTISNSVFVDARKGMEIWNADDNLIKNCVFDSTGGWALVRFPLDRVGHGNSCRNSIVAGISGELLVADVGSTEEFPFTYTDFSGNSFDMPQGVGNLDKDPLFADPANLDYHLKSLQGRWDTTSSAWVKDSEMSPCIDVGDPADDYSAEPCPNGGRINMGAYGGTTEASMGSTSTPCIPQDGGMLDGGTQDGGGVDGGTQDGGGVDGGTLDGGGVDGGTPSGAEDSSDGGGCECRMQEAPVGVRAPTVLCILALLRVGRRRRQGLRCGTASRSASSRAFPG